CRFALRSWIKAPSFAVAAMATLALGIGANTAVVTIANGVLVRPLPFVQPENLVQLNETLPPSTSGTGFDGPVVYLDFDQWRTHSTLIERAVTYSHHRKNLQEGAEIEPVITVGAERGLFPMLGVAPLLGRTFDEQDPANVAVAAYGFWKDHFNGDPSGGGPTLTIKGDALTVIGVRPEGFEFPYRTSRTGLYDGFASTALWMPWQIPAATRAHPGWRLEWVLARLKPGATVEATRAELAAMEGPAKG